MLFSRWGNIMECHLLLQSSVNAFSLLMSFSSLASNLLERLFGVKVLLHCAGLDTYFESTRNSGE